MDKLPIHNFPKRKYCEGKKKMYSMRLSETLMEKLNSIAKENGTTVTEIVQIGMDEFIQWLSKRK